MEFRSLGEIIRFGSLKELDPRVITGVKSHLGKVAPDFTGAILRRYVPKSDEGISFLGDFGQGTEIDLEDSIGVNHISEDGLWRPQDCFTDVRTNVEGCAFAINRNFGRFASSLPDEFATPKQTNQPGCYGFDIFAASYTRDPNRPVIRRFIRIFVSVAATEVGDPYDLDEVAIQGESVLARLIGEDQTAVIY
jgi:hypothetical protein